MQRIGALSVGLLALAPAPARAQETLGTTLWRVAATTLPTPPALARGAAAALWNPAQPPDSAASRLHVAVEAIQTPSSIDASGVIAAVRMPVGRIGQLGLIYGRVGLSDITQTTDTPDPSGTGPVYTFAVGATWARRLGGTDVGATIAFHETRLDLTSADRWTVDVGVSRVLAGDRVRIAAATHFFSSFTTDNPAQDYFAGVEARLWNGPITARGDRAVIRGRYGVSFGHGFTADHQFGVGAELSRAVELDLLVAREGSYGDAGWRPVAGLRFAIGKYQVAIARDAGVNDLGSAYRVGVEARFK